MKQLTMRILLLLSIGLMAISPVQAALPDFKQYASLKMRKQAFFHYLLPLAEHINAKILRTRTRLMSLHVEARDDVLTSREKEWLGELAEKYKVKSWDMLSEKAWHKLINRVDIVPVSMLLAQAAKESAWGTSRFAQEGNNLFGQWCHRQGCGIIPERRASGSHHEVKKFRSVADSISAYINNLNANNAYREFRNLRKHARAEEESLSGVALAAGLSRYSQQGQAYVSSVQSIIRKNHLSKYDAI